ncbi:protein carboxyl-o-methyltransferase [Basidiobolus meristosporus CBS 931.73]|uniref:protein-L-isoaspartate(D-aspartate) O-methyltransferase n=1 Tax=Basidiobolus meristosporus CBS 931.73 TaxID=1314790 RepID=A0A1Y1Y2L7_9FUNG|nr:protein carboxyl-o-methyltransferase [Basidiobolus meristosporus CBS 931.73]|eukprot:ORX92257.1 protein carboxyl-o-methyltransferase [Basidiobolus meristosporus CBS 931.73]
MAWRCSANTNIGLINNLKASGIIQSTEVYRAMSLVDRKHYAPIKPYDDSPQTIGYGATISAPHMHAYALEYLKGYLKPGMKALDVGSGSGYLTSCMASMVGENGQVVGIEHISELVDLSTNNVKADHPEFLESGRVQFVTGDGRKGHPENGPYDCIHVGAAAVKTPMALINQLKSPGRMFIPVGSELHSQSIYQIDKDENGEIKEEELMGVMYVPLTDAEKQRGNW